MTHRAKHHGFTLIETLVVIALTVMFIGIGATTLIAFQRIHQREFNELEITQNARVIVDRITRELRQTNVLVTPLPQFRDEPGNPPPSEIQFQDGHDISTTRYIEYSLNGTDLNRRIIQYEFPTSPGVPVVYDARDEFGNPPDTIEIENRVMAEYISDIDYWGLSLIHLAVTFTKNGATLTTESAVHARNL